ncbi:P protein [strawberry-associated virus 1]|uniref:P protein n=1 Tax=strawberry-associated virus 1 TaxID=2594796 RepID=A0A514TP70_9RHAB|nr:P protein [Strawberry associated virus 1]
MAQYEFDPLGEDFSDIGDLVGTLNYANLNSDDPPEVLIQVPVNTEVPLRAAEVKDQKQKSKIITEAEKGSGSKSIPVLTYSEMLPDRDSEIQLEGDEAVASLHELCDELGIVATKQMENQVFRLSKKEIVTRSSIKWFVRGYNNCLGSHILSALRENMADMRTEIKRLQSGSATMIRGSDALAAASGQLLTRIDEAKDDIRERLHASLVNVEETVADTLNRVRTMERSERAKDELGTLAAETVRVTPKLSPADTVGRTVAKIETTVPEVVPPLTVVGQHSKASTADAESPVKVRRALMSRVGFTASFSNNLSESVLLEAIPPSLLSEIKGVSMSPRVKAAIKKIITENIIKLTAK